MRSSGDVILRCNSCVAHTLRVNIYSLDIVWNLIIYLCPTYKYFIMGIFNACGKCPRRWQAGRPSHVQWGRRPSHDQDHTRCELAAELATEKIALSTGKTDCTRGAQCYCPRKSCTVQGQEAQYSADMYSGGSQTQGRQEHRYVDIVWGSGKTEKMCIC